MDTATERKLAEQERGSLEPSARALLDHPQRLGILPTLWFWNEPASWRLIAKPFGVTVVIVFVAMMVLFAGVELPFGVLTLASMAVLVLVLGGFERYVRSRARRRFRALKRTRLRRS